MFTPVTITVDAGSSLLTHALATLASWYSLGVLVLLVVGVAAFLVALLTPERTHATTATSEPAAADPSDPSPSAPTADVPGQRQGGRVPSHV